MGEIVENEVKETETNDAVPAGEKTETEAQVEGEKEETAAE